MKNNQSYLYSSIVFKHVFLTSTYVESELALNTERALICILITGGASMNTRQDWAPADDDARLTGFSIRPGEEKSWTSQSEDHKS